LEFWAAEFSVSVRSLYRFISVGELHAVKIGSRTVITPENWQAFIDSRPAAGGAMKKAVFRAA